MKLPDFSKEATKERGWCRFVNSARFDFVTSVIVGLDFAVSSVALISSVYDTSLPAALSQTILAQNLYSSSNGWRVCRTILFALSMSLRLLMGLEMLARVLAKPTKTDFFRNFKNLLDFLVVIFAIIARPCLPSRESLLFGPLIIFPRFWRVGLMYEASLEAIRKTITDQMDSQSKAYEVRFAEMKKEVAKANSYVNHYQQKLRMLTGENSILIDENQLGFHELYAMHEEQLQMPSPI